MSKQWGVMNDTINIIRACLIKNDFNGAKQAIDGYAFEMAPVELQDSIHRLNLEERLCEFLANEGIDCINVLAQKTTEQVLAMPGIGQTYLDQLRKAFTDLGLNGRFLRS